MEKESATIIGTFGQGIISYSCHNGQETQIHFAELQNAFRRDLNRKTLTRRKSLVLNTQDNYSKKLLHASIQYLDKVRNSEKDHQASNFQLNAASLYGGVNRLTVRKTRFALLAIVWKEILEGVEYYSASVSLLCERHTPNDSDTRGESTTGKDSVEVTKVAELMLVNKFDRMFHAHLLPPYKRPVEEESDADTTEVEKISSFKNRLIILNLNESMFLPSTKIIKI